MSRRFTPEDIIKLVKGGKLPEKNLDLFTSGIPAQNLVGIVSAIKSTDFDTEGFRTLNLWIPCTELILNPVAKQSFRVSPTRHYKSGTHTCLYCNKEAFHKQGDVMTYRNKKTGLVDVIMAQYTDKKIITWEKYLKQQINIQLPIDFIKFNDEIHITRLWFIFEPLKGFTKAQEELIKKGDLIRKKTKPDIDNLTKPIYDAMQEIIMDNDSIISRELDKGKFYGASPGVLINLKGK